MKARARKLVLQGTLLACVLLAWCPSAFALDPSVDINQYAHRAWTVREGYFKGSVDSIAQTPDGYIWLGTTFGLIRFDGLKTANWQPPQDQQLPSNFVMSLLAARDGTLWIGTGNGLASFKNGKLTVYPETIGHFIFAVVEDREGTIWGSAVSSTLGKLCTIRNGNMNCEGEGTIGRGAFNLYVDSQGTLWAGVKDGLWRWSPGPPKFYPLPGEPNGIQGLGEAEDGTLLVAWNGALQRFRDGKTEVYPVPGIAGPIQIKRIFRDHDGSLWLATYTHGLLHLHSDRTDVFTQSDGLSGDFVLALFEDRESNIWVTTANGLDCFRNFAVSTLTTKQGLSHDLVAAILADKDGSLWFSTSAGLDRWRNGKIETSPLGRSGNLNDLPGSLFQDRSGQVWVGKVSGFGYLEGQRFVPLRGVPQSGLVLAIAEDRTGDLWLANEHLGLFHVQSGNAVGQIAWETLGHKEHASVLAADPAQGGLWIGFFHGGIAYFENGQVRASYTSADGLGAGRVSSFHFDDNGALWISTEQGGLSRLKNGRIATLTSKNGLPCDTVNWVMEDDDYAFWLYTACGLVRIARPEMDAWTTAVDRNSDAKPTVQFTVFDFSDGVRSLATGGHDSPVVAKTSDGRIWFLPWDGVSVFDPRNLYFNKIQPPVHIEQITADRISHDVTTDINGQLSLPARSRDLEIDYTALSLVAPEKIRFRYKLEGYDRDWQDAGNRRQAFYTNLPPRNYRFRVMACNNSGVWNETGTFLDFSIAPAFYQTRWFVAAMIALGVLLVGGIYRLRVRQISRRMSARFDERLDERTRVARELHDTFLQTVQGSKMVADHALKHPEDHARMVQAMGQLSTWLGQATQEGRTALNSLRASTTEKNDLAEAFRRAIDECRLESPMEISFSVKGDAREIHPVVRDEIYRIGYEAIRNACTHSGAPQVEVALEYAHDLTLRVSDNGLGIDSEIIAKGKQGHFGLRGMRERALRIGSKLALVSSARDGTDITLTVPGRIVFHHEAPSWWERVRSLFSS